MFRHTIGILFLGLILGGCASNGGSSTTPGGGGTASGSATTSPMMSSTATAESPDAKQSRQTRIAAGVEEETLDTCIARIPQNATPGQRMLAEQTCRRDFSVRR